MSTWKKSILLFTLLLAGILTGCSGVQQSPVESSPAPIDTPTNESGLVNDGPVETKPTDTEQVSEPQVIDIPQDRPVISLTNAGQLKQTASLDIENPASILWALDSKSLLVTSPGKISRIEAGIWQITKEYSPEDENAFIMDMSPDGKTIAVTSDYSLLELLDIDNNQQKLSIDITEMFLDAAFSPDGKVLAIASAEEIAAQLYDAESGTFIKTLKGYETAAPVYGFTFTADNRSLLWVSRAKAQLMDIESGKLGQEFYHEDFIANAIVSPSGEYLVISTGATVEEIYSPVILIRDTLNGEQVGQIVTIAISSISISPDSSLLAAGNGPYLFVWNLETQEELAILDGISPGITAISFSPDGQTIATTAQDNTVRIWQVE